MLEINEGKYAGTKFEEPYGEGVSLFSSTVDIEDVTITMKINYDIDRLSMDVNEWDGVKTLVNLCPKH